MLTYLAGFFIFTFILVALEQALGLGNKNLPNPDDIEKTRREIRRALGHID